MIFDDKYFIGRKIKSFRKKRGLTQAELAEKIDLSEKHISKIEASIHVPSLSAFFKIAEALEIGMEEFGFELKTDGNPDREELIKCIFDSTDEEIKLILSVVKCLKENFISSYLSYKLRLYFYIALRMI